MLRNRTAFSLVEILVVIAIIGIVAAIAAPGFANYSRRAKVQQTMETVRAIANKVKIYYDSHNAAAPSIAAYGLSPDTGNSQLLQTPDPTNIDEYLTKYLASVSVSSVDAVPGTCAYISINPVISNFDSVGAYPDSPSRVIYAFIRFINVNGEWRSLCAFQDYLLPDNSPYTDTTIPGCYNIEVLAEATEFNNQFATVSALCN